MGRTFFLRDPELPAFDLETVMLATGNFSKANKIGEGGFGDVYKVTSFLLNHQVIA